MKRKIFRDRLEINVNVERVAKEQLEDIAAEGRKTFSLALDEAIFEYIERKKVMGLGNPIKIKYDEVNKKYSLFDFLPIGHSVNQLEAKMLMNKFVEAGFDIHKLRGSCNQILQEIDRRIRYR